MKIYTSRPRISREAFFALECTKMSSKGRMMRTAATAHMNTRGNSVTV